MGKLHFYDTVNFVENVVGDDTKYNDYLIWLEKTLLYDTSLPKNISNFFFDMADAEKRKPKTFNKIEPIESFEFSEELFEDCQDTFKYDAPNVISRWPWLYRLGEINKFMSLPSSI